MEARFTYELNSKHRSILYAFAIIFVILFHSHNHGLNLNLGIIDDSFAFGFGGVDIFILLSGMSISLSILKNKYDYGTYVKRRLIRIMPAYLFVMIPFTILLIIFENAPIYSIITNASLLYYFLGTKGSFNWYISVIMFFYLLAPIITKVLYKIKHRIVFIVVISIFSIVFSQLLIDEGFWRILDLTYRIPNFIIGIYLGILIFDKKKYTIKTVIVSIIMFLIGVGYYFIWQSSPTFLTNTFFPLAYLFTFTTLPVCILLSFLCEIIKIKPIRFVLDKVGISSLEIYLLNVSFFDRVDVLNQDILYGKYSILIFVGLIILNILLGILFHYVNDFFTKKILNIRKKEIVNT